jgi:hypothetical protein
MIEAPQNENTDYEAVYLSENFGIPFTTALKITKEAADKKAKKKKKK